MLAAHGLTGLTTRAIAREAQVADGVLYNHFSDKDELIVAAMAEQIDGLVSAFDAGCPTPGAQDLTSGLSTLARLCLEFQEAILPLIGGLFSRPELMHRLFEEIHSHEAGPRLIWQRICDYVAAEQSLGNAADDGTPSAVAEALIGAMQVEALGGMFAMGSTGNGALRVADRESLVAFLVRGLRPGLPSSS
jgi:AcrR family transcriptional regulator